MRNSVFIIFILGSMLLIGCEPSGSNSATLPSRKKLLSQRKGDLALDSANNSLIVTAQKTPIVTIVDSNVVGFSFIYSSDSAANQKRVSLKQNNIYINILNPLIAAKRFTVVGPRMAVYDNFTAPYFFDVGYIFEKASTDLPRDVRVRYYKSSKALIAHFSGPYELLNIAYSSLQEQMKTNNYKSNGKPYEWYITNPGDTITKNKDPYTVRTDVIFPYEEN